MNSNLQPSNSHHIFGEKIKFLLTVLFSWLENRVVGDYIGIGTIDGKFLLFELDSGSEKFSLAPNKQPHHFGQPKNHHESYEEDDTPVIIPGPDGRLFLEKRTDTGTRLYVCLCCQNFQNLKFVSFFVFTK